MATRAVVAHVGHVMPLTASVTVAIAPDTAVGSGRAAVAVSRHHAVIVAGQLRVPARRPREPRERPTAIGS